MKKLNRRRLFFNDLRLSTHLIHGVTQSNRDFATVSGSFGPHGQHPYNLNLVLPSVVDTSAKVVASDHTSIGIPRNFKDALVSAHMSRITKDPTPTLPKAPQPPLSYRGATPDSNRAKKPRLAEPFAIDQELNPGDRVEGLGNFGKPTGEFGTVEQANEDDAVVRWDDEVRVRLRQPWLKKV